MPTRGRPGGFVPALDGLRGVSAQVVCLAHAAGICLPTGSVALEIVGWLARAAVIVFFVLSGFAITLAIGKLRSERGGRFDLAVFAAHRLARIYPPYLASIVLVVAIALLFRGGWLVPHGVAGEVARAVGAGELARTLVFGYLQDDLANRLDGPLWSLRLEVALYLMTACAAVAVDGSGFLRWTALLVGGALAAAVSARLFFGLPAILLFGFGSAAALAWRSGASPRTSPDRAALLFGLAVGAAAVPVAAFDVLDLARPSWSGVLIQLAVGLLAALLVLHLAARESRTGAALAGLGGLGSFAFTLYVVHVPLFILGRSLILSFEPSIPGPVFAVGMMGVLAAVELASLGLARLVERPAWYRARLAGLAGLR